MEKITKKEGESKHRKNKYLISACPISAVRIEKLDFYFHEDSLSLFKDKNEEDLIHIESLNKLKKIYIDRIRQINLEIKQCQKDRNYDHLHQLEVYRRDLSLLQKYIDKSQRHQTRRLQKNIRTVKRMMNEELEEAPSLEDEVYNAMKEGTILLNVPTELQVKAFCKYIYENEVEINQMHYFVNILTELRNISDKEKSIFLYQIMDTVRIKRSRLNKEESKKEKEILKQIQKEVELTLSLYGKKTPKKKDTYYKLIETMIENPINYKSIETSIHEIKDLLNAEKEGMPIFIKIIDFYIENCKKELAGQRNIPYIDKDYFKNLFLLFLSEPELEIKKFMTYIKLRFDSFIEEVKSASDNSPLSKGKNIIYNDIAEMENALSHYHQAQKRIQIIEQILQECKQISKNIVDIRKRRQIASQYIEKIYEMTFLLTKTKIRENHIKKTVPFPYNEKEIKKIDDLLEQIKRALLPYINAVPILDYFHENLVDIEKEEKEKERLLKVKEAIQNIEKSTSYLIDDDKRIHLDQEYLKEIKKKIFTRRDALLTEGKKYQSPKEIGAFFEIDAFNIENALGFNKTVSFGNTRHCYSIVEHTNHRIYLQMHQIDLASYLDCNTYLKEELWKNMIEGKNSVLDKYDILKFEKGKKVPAITYQIRLKENGSLGNLGIYHTVVELDEIYDNNDLEEKEQARKFLSIYKNMFESKITDVKNIDLYFEEMFRTKIQNYMSYNYEPGICLLHTEEDEKRFMQSHYERVSLYSKIPKVIARKMYDIDVQFYCHHYGNEPFDAYACLESMDRLNYITYFNQKVLFVKPEIEKKASGRKIYKTPDRILDLSNQCIQKLNQSLGYIDDTYYHEQNKKIKKMNEKN